MFVSNGCSTTSKKKGEQTTADGSGVEIPPMPITIFSTASCWRSWSGTAPALSDGFLPESDGWAGENQWTYSYQGNYLREYDLGGDGFTALLLNRYRSGSVGRLVTVGEDGAELASLDVNEEVVGISAAGRHLAVLYTDQLVIYTPELETYATLVGTDPPWMCCSGRMAQLCCFPRTLPKCFCRDFPEKLKFTKRLHEER